MRQFGEKRRTDGVLWNIMNHRLFLSRPTMIRENGMIARTPDPNLSRRISPVQFVSILENLSISLGDYQFIKI